MDQKVRKTRSAPPEASHTVSRPELLVDGSDMMFRKLVHDLFAFLYRHEAIRAGHAEYIGLAGIEYTILISIAHLQRSRDVNIKTVGDHLHVTGAFVTRVVNKLVRMGLVDKETVANDRRYVSIKVTDKGREWLARLAPAQRKVNDVEFGSLSRQEFVDLCRIVAKLVDDGDEALALQKYLKAAEPKLALRAAS